MSELDEIRKKKLRSYEEELNHQAQKQQVEIVKKEFMFTFLTKEARERLNNVRLVNPQLAEQVEIAVIQAANVGQIRNKIKEEDLKEILRQMTQKKREFKIIRK